LIISFVDVFVKVIFAHKNRVLSLFQLI